MSFAQDNGYTPTTFNGLMDLVRIGINAQFSTTYTAETFIGTNWYKLAYPLVQRVQQGEITTSEVFAALSRYIEQSNQSIQRPSVSQPGIIDSFESQGFVVSTKDNVDSDAGKLFLCVDVDQSAASYATVKSEILELLSDYIVGPLVTQGSETGTVVLSNGQSFTYRYDLPNRIPVLLRLTAVKSDNTTALVPGDIPIRQAIYKNILGEKDEDGVYTTSPRYRLGYDFAPQRYFNVSDDAPWAESLVLEWSSNAGSTWHSNVYSAAGAGFKDLFTFALEDIAVVIS